MARNLLELTVNGRLRTDAVADNTLLLDYLRDRAGLTGTKQGCDGGECGACTVLIDGEPRLSCITLAASCAGRQVETIEALAVAGRMSRLQEAFRQARHPVRILHAGDDHGGRSAAAAQSASRRRRDPRGALGQSVSLHRLRQDSRVGARGRRRLTL